MNMYQLQRLLTYSRYKHYCPSDASADVRCSFAMLTVTPEPPALAIMRPASSAVTAALRTQSNRHARTPESAEATKPSTNLPDCYRTCTHPACAHYEDTGEEPKQHGLRFVSPPPSPDFCLLPDWSLRCRFLECHSRSQCLDTPRLSAHTAKRSFMDKSSRRWEC